MKRLFGIDDPAVEKSLRKGARSRFAWTKQRIAVRSYFIALGIALTVILNDLLGIRSPFTYVVLCGSVLLLHIVVGKVFERRDRVSLEKELAAAARCVKCGYDLKNIGSNCCPECGTISDRKAG